ncbi:DnaB-like helicase C-terminal domain-containing protein [Nocardioides astragali]|uniref:DnaB-like helicase C-terminal domain-containing protein n=1 Tax=Nocardioides astragali TaxID=1776736 RepID=A0ABW2N8T5_9ACTN|nr:DnaB-like helicase C-terminal domain-containing protein [Nocardioides astragali]
MVSVVEAMQLLEVARAERPEQRTTGLPALDESTGGFDLGQCWIVVGTPGQGRSALAAQWAWLLASQHGFTTQLVSTKEPVARVATRLAASVAKVPMSHFGHRGLSGRDPEKLRRVGPRLESAPLSIVGPGELSIADVDMDELPSSQVLVVDDSHHSGGMCPQRTAALAARGHLVVLTLPRYRVVSNAGIEPTWADVADFILDIDRPDLLDRTSLRPGEADLHLLRNRWGPTQSHLVGFQGHYSRFVDMARV